MSEISVAVESTGATDRTEPLSQAVVESVARAEGVDPLDLEVPLYDAVDPDALDALFQQDGTSGDGRIQFSYYGYRVTVTGAGHVTLDDVADDRQPDVTSPAAD